jgi:transcriptional regulator with XRE-family HTH domain
VNSEHSTQAGQLVAEARASAGISQRELARRSGVPGPVVNAIERSRRQPSIPTLAKILRGLDLDVRLHVVPTSDRLGSDGRISQPLLAASGQTVSVRLISEAERVRARRVYDALSLAHSIKRSKQRERIRGVR